MKKLNVKFVVTLTAVIVVSSLSVFFVQNWQVKRHADSLKRRADIAREESKLYEAIRLRRRYLQHYPDDDRQFAELSRDFLEFTLSGKANIHQRQQAYSIMEAALRRNEDDRQLRREAVDFLIKARAYSTAIAHLKTLMKQDDEKQDTKLQVQLAKCHVQMGEFDEASMLLESIIGYDTDGEIFDVESATALHEIDAYVLLAAYYRDHQLEDDHADRVMDQLVKQNPESYRSYYERARHLERYDNEREKLDRAREDINKSRELAPDEANVIVKFAEIQAADREFEVAKKTLETGLEKHPKNEQIFVALSNLAQRQNDLAEAKKWVIKGIKKLPNSHVLLIERSELEFAAQDTEAVRRTSEALRRTGVPADWTDYIDARVLLLEGKWPQASVELERLYSRLPQYNPGVTTQLDLNLGLCYERLAQWDRALDSYRNIPLSAGLMQASIGTARCLVALKRFGEAAVIYSRIIKDQEKSIANANKEGRADQKIDPKLHVALLGMLMEQQKRLIEDQREWDDVDRLHKQIMANKDIPAKQRAEIAIQYRQARGEDTTKIRDAIRKQFPKDLQSRLSELENTFQEEGVEKALPMLAQLTEDFGDIPILRITKANMILQIGGADVKSSLTELEKDIEEWTDRDRIQLWSRLAGFHYQLRDFDRVRQLWQSVADTDPDNFLVHERFFDLGLETNDEEAMLAALDNLKQRLTKESSTWRLAEARRLIWKVQTKRSGEEALVNARRLMGLIREQRPDWHMLPRLEAEINLIENDKELAAQNFQRSLQLGPKDPRVIRRLTRLLISQEQPDEAKKWIDQIDSSQRTRTDRMLLVELRGHADQFDLAAMDRVVPIDTDNSQELLWRGQVLGKNGHPDLARQAFQRVMQLSPRSPQLWLNLVEVLLKEGKHNEVDEAIRQARLYVAENRIPLTLGSCHEMAAKIGVTTLQERRRHWRAAERNYLMALHNDPENDSRLRTVATFYISGNNHKESTKYLNALIKNVKPYASDAPPNVLWARHRLAELKASTGSYQDYLQAIDIIQQNRPHDGELSTEDLLVWGNITLPRPDSSSRQRLIIELQKTGNTRESTPGERLMMARLLERDGQWDQAQQLMGDLVGAHRDHPEIVSLYIEMLVRHDQLSQAQQLLDSLQEGSQVRVRIEAYILAKQGKEQQAVEKLMKLIPDPLPREQHSLLSNIARLLEEINQHDVAEQLLRRFVQLQPEQELVLISFLGRREGVKSLDEAFRLCEKAIASESYRPEAITQIGVHSLRAHRLELIKAGKATKKKYFGQVAKWFDIANKQSPESLPLLLQRGEFEELNNNLSETIKLYRQFISAKKVPTRQRAIVMNNLAYLLAVRSQGKEALKLIEQSIAELGPTSDLLDTRAMAFIAEGDYNSAVQDLRNALHSGDSAAKLFHLAYAQMLSRKIQEAKNSFAEAQELGLEPTLMSDADRDIYDRLLKKLELDS